MKTELIHSLTSTFEAHAQQAEGATEYWLASDLKYLPGYADGRNFSASTVSKAKAAREQSGPASSDHFVDVNKTIDLASGSQRAVVRRVRDICCLTRRRLLNSIVIDLITFTGYRRYYIRPMAVRPLDHPECWPTPWGFLFSGLGKTWVAASQRWVL